MLYQSEMILLARLLAIVTAFAVSGCAQTTSGVSPNSPKLEVEWVKLPRALPQGRAVFSVRLRNLTKQDLELSEWIEEGWGANFVVAFYRLGTNTVSTNPPPAAPRGLVRRASYTLKGKERLELSGEFNLNVEPGEYEVVAHLRCVPTASSPRVKLRVTTGKITDPGK